MSIMAVNNGLNDALVFIQRGAGNIWRQLRKRKHAQRRNTCEVPCIQGK